MSSLFVGANHKNPAALWRCFVALPLPDEALGWLSQQQDDLRRDLPHPALRWVSLQHMHLTLVFLGNVEADQLEGLHVSLLGAARSVSPFRLSASGLGCFPTCTRPRVLWAGLQGDASVLHLLQRKVVEAAQPFAEQLDSKLFRPHLTLARLKFADRHLNAQIGRLLAQPIVAKETGPTWLASEAILMRSELHPQGAVHSILGRMPFLGA